MDRENNFYKKKFDELIKLKFSKLDAFSEVCNMYLDGKPKKETISNHDRNEMFWPDPVWSELPPEVLNTELFAIALHTNFLNQSIYNLPLIKVCADLYPDIVIKTVKSSKIFIEKKNNYEQIKDELGNDTVFKDFFIVCDVLATNYTKLYDKVTSYRNTLNSYAYLDLLCLISLYMMQKADEHAVSPFLFEHRGRVLSKILQDRLETNDKKKRAIDEAYVQQKLGSYLISLTPPANYEQFEELVQAYSEFLAFENNELSTFCYDENFTFSLESEFVQLLPINVEEYIKWYMDRHKIFHLSQYYEQEAIVDIDRMYQGTTFGSPENGELNKSVFVRAMSNVSLLSEIYGIDQDSIDYDNVHSIQVFPVLHGISSLLALYGQEYVRAYSDFQKEFSDFWEGNYYFIGQGIFAEKDRKSLVDTRVNEFADTIQKQHHIENAENVEMFWTNDLRDTHKINEKVPNIFEKPFFKLDDFVFRVPWILAFQHPTTTFLNSLLRVHHNRKDRKKEVHGSEKFIHNLFLENGFSVKYSYDLLGEKNQGLGDIDVICFKDGHLFVMELKSTFIRTSMQESWIYRTKVLRKAGHQLSKRVKAIKDNVLSDENFIETFGRTKHIHSWIIDTSFDFDHEHFDGSLKVSSFELMYALNSENEDYYPDGFNVDQFIKIIESQRLWNEVLGKPEISVEDITYSVPRI